MLFGTKVQPLLDLCREQPAHPGHAAARGWCSRRRRHRGGPIGDAVWREKPGTRNDFCAYLSWSAALSVAGYVVGRCGAINIHRTGRNALGSGRGRPGGVVSARRAGTVAATRVEGIVLTLAAVNVTAHGRLWHEYLRDTPVGYKALIARADGSDGIRYATADYGLAYSITFLTNEQIIIRSDRPRILEYNRMISAHWKEVVRLSRRPCPGEAPTVPPPRLLFLPAMTPAARYSRILPTSHM